MVKNKIKNVVGYTRISSDSQKDNTSINEQIKRIQAYCISQNWNLVQVFSKQKTITVIISDFTLLERLNTISQEYDKDWDTLINMAIRWFVDNVEELRGLRIR